MKHFCTRLIFFFVIAIFSTIAHTSFALTVSPAKIEVLGDPGATITGTVELYNEKTKNQNIYTSFENFESNDDTGTPRFIGNDDRLATWMSAPLALSLNPDERIDVTYTITIPEDAEPGGYFAAMFFGNQPPQNESQVSIGGRLGVLVLLRVSGDVPESGGILDFGATDEKRFFLTPPIKFTHRFSNTGGDRVAPLGNIELKNTFGFVRDRVDANPKKGSILPDTARKFVNTWGRKGESPEGFFDTAASQWNQFHFGWYTARLNLNWGEKGQESIAKYSFFIFPWHLLLVSFVTLLLAFFILKIVGRSYKQSLVRQIEKQYEESQKKQIKSTKP
jgi:hypothetical protein